MAENLHNSIPIIIATAINDGDTQGDITLTVTVWACAGSNGGGGDGGICDVYPTIIEISMLIGKTLVSLMSDTSIKYL